MGRRLTAVVVACACALAAGGTASAETSSLGVARAGSLTVSSFVIAFPRAVELRGGWNNDGVPCNQSRRLRVAVEIFYTPFGATGRRIARVRTGIRMNCAEGGPNLGFSLRADGNGLACPDGTWKPGRYTFVTETRHLASGLRALADLSLEQPVPC
jgi:hypothetical protein